LEFGYWNLFGFWILEFGIYFITYSFTVTYTGR
jgi:hypothetical protein